MTPAPHNPEQDLSQSLARQADRFAERGGSPLELDQVLSRAGEIRRGRRMRASMVMAAVVLAVAVPVGISTLNDPAKQPPIAESTTPDTSDITLGDLKKGDEPRDGYLYGGQLHHNGTIPTGDGLTPYSAARIAGAYLLSRPRSVNGGVTISVISDDQNGTETTWSSESAFFAVSPEKNVGAFVDNRGTVIAVQDGGTQHFDLGTLPDAVGYQPLAVTGESCSGGSGEAGCTVYVELSFEDRTPEVWAVSPNLAPKRVFDDLLKVSSVATDGRVAGQISSSDEGSCSEVRDAGGASLWKTCEFSLDRFSPDGRYLLAGPAYRSGSGDSSMAIVDTQTWKVVLALDTQPGAFIAGLVWEDATHVLVPVYDKATWAVQRISLDGNREYATPKAPDDGSYVSPFKLG